MNHSDFCVYRFSQSIQRKLMYKWDRKDMTECSFGTLSEFLKLEFN